MNYGKRTRYDLDDDRRDNSSMNDARSTFDNSIRMNSLINNANNAKKSVDNAMKAGKFAIKHPVATILIIVAIIISIVLLIVLTMIFGNSDDTVLEETDYRYIPVAYSPNPCDNTEENDANDSESNVFDSDSNAKGWHTGKASGYGGADDPSVPDNTGTATGDKVNEYSKGVAIPMSMNESKRNKLYGKKIEISYNGKSVIAKINDCGSMKDSDGTQRALDLQPGVFKALLGQDNIGCNTWGVREVKYRVLCADVSLLDDDGIDSIPDDDNDNNKSSNNDDTSSDNNSDDIKKEICDGATDSDGTSSIESGDWVLMKQSDPKWGSENFGNVNIGSSGCWITSYAMIWTKYSGKEHTPLDVKKACENGTLSPAPFNNQGLGVRDNIPSSLNNLNIGLECELSSSIDMSKVDEILKTGGCVFEYRDGTHQHATVIAGKKKGKTYEVADPAIGKMMNYKFNSNGDIVKDYTGSKQVLGSDGFVVYCKKK